MGQLQLFDKIDPDMQDSHEIFSIGKNRYLGINKKDKFYPDFKQVCERGEYLLLPYDHTQHRKYCAIAVRTLEKLQKLFPEKNFTEVYETTALGDSKVVLSSYGKIVADLKEELFIKEMKASVERHAGCYHEIHDLLHAVKDPFKNKNAKPYIDALIYADLTITYPFISRKTINKIVQAVFGLLSEFYRRNGFSKKTRATREQFEKAIDLISTQYSTISYESITNELIEEWLSMIPLEKATTIPYSPPVTSLLFKTPHYDWQPGMTFYPPQPVVGLPPSQALTDLSSSTQSGTSPSLIGDANRFFSSLATSLPATLPAGQHQTIATISREKSRGPESTLGLTKS
jgi:hypothetical protein